MGACDGLQQLGCAGAVAGVAQGRVFANAWHEGCLQALQHGLGSRCGPCAAPMLESRLCCSWGGRKGQGTAVDISMLTLVFRAAAADLRACALGWVGGSPGADDNPCLSTWLHPIMAHKTPVSLFFFFWTIPVCFSCSKGETDPAVGMPVPLVLVLPLQPQTPRVNGLTSSVVSPTPPFPPSSPGCLSSPCRVTRLNRAGSCQLWPSGCQGGDLVCWPVDKFSCSFAVPFFGGVLQLSKSGGFQSCRDVGLQSAVASYRIALTGVWSQVACSSKPTAVYLLPFFNPALTVSPV